jgi:uncharacterized protein
LSACLSNEIPCTALLIPTSTGMPGPEDDLVIIETNARNPKNDKFNRYARQLGKEEGRGLKKHMRGLIIIVHEEQEMQQEESVGERPRRQVIYILVIK